MMQDKISNIKSRTNISAWIVEQNRKDVIPLITTNVFQSVSARRIPSVPDRADILLLEVMRAQDQVNEYISIENSQFIAPTYSKDSNEVRSLSHMLHKEGLLTTESGTQQDSWVQVSLSGHKRAEQLVRRPSDGALVFVAMPFSDDLASAYEWGIKVAIESAGYEAVRVDKVHHVNRIDDEIIARIRASVFIVADFTKHNAGVYFEAGFALGIGLPVIWCCRKDHMTELHFDIRQYNCIDWEDTEDLASRLQLRIEAIAGKGPKAVLGAA